MIDYYEYSIPELVKLLGARFNDYRLRSNMTQKEVSEQSGITITTIHKFENGTSGNVSLGTFRDFCITFTMMVSIMRNSVVCRSLITSRLMILPLCSIITATPPARSLWP